MEDQFTMNIKAILKLVLIFSLIFSSSLLSQSKKYEGPDDPAGDIAAERVGLMEGNRVRLQFRNTTELSDWGAGADPFASKWPNTYYGTKMTDGIGLLIGARVYITQDSIPVTDPAQIVVLAAQGQLDTLYYLQTSYREEMDTDPTGTFEWGLYPVFGYFHVTSETPAMSNRPESWPPNGWPARGRDLKWQGEWDGRFGRGIIYADLECYFVANDAQDQEYLPANNAPVKYYPRPGTKIGDIKPDVTIQYGQPWGGVGIRVEQRGFQWENPQARDAIFWEYTIANISDYDLTEVGFGYWVDNAIGGGDENDELAAFDRIKDLAYSWDINGVGTGGFLTGTLGFAFLESPGIAWDNQDNDDDGLVDEKRDNHATAKIGPYDGITDLQKFLDFYRKKEKDLREHWDADEDQDWDDGLDLNGNGIYDEGEPVGDDVGIDGVGPGELQYDGPDEGECNHKPDFLEGVGSEPDFAWTDVSESDMLGLTSFRLFPIPSHSEPYRWWFRNDKSMWELVGGETLIEYKGDVSNLVELFASGVFPLYAGRTERISMAELHSYDPLEGLQSTKHTAPALFRLKEIVQMIYERDYRFAQPPKMPTLTATPGDGCVILTWDRIAEAYTKEPFLNGINDFEGYKLYRATDKRMTDPEIITDGYGTLMFKLPIFQCDMKDDRFGFTDFGLVNGMGYNLGTESGISNYFIDNTVQNGRTYYYALVAYDYGIPPDELKISGFIDVAAEERIGIAPSENSIVIELDEAEEVSFIGRNVAEVTPHQEAAGYNMEQSYELKENNIFGTGTIVPEVVAKNSLKQDHTYCVTFGVNRIFIVRYYEDGGILYSNHGIYVHDITDGSNVLIYKDAVEKNEEGREITNNLHTVLTKEDTIQVGTRRFKAWHIRPGEITTGIFEGIRLKINTPIIAEYDSENSGWLSGNAPINITVTEGESHYFPWDYDIVFTGDDSVYASRVQSRSRIYDENTQSIGSELLLNISFSFYVQNHSYVDSTTGNYELMDMVVHDLNQNGQFDILEDRILVGPLNSKDRWAGTIFIIDFTDVDDENELPKPGDVYRITYKRPFLATDSLILTVKADEILDEVALIEEIDNIRVVPNPYIHTNAMEPAVANWNLNQRRRLMFTHIPAKCIIKIFTMSGVLVDVIDVDNPADNGIVHWDLLSKEGLEVAAGVYIYHVKSEVTGKKKLGKFAVIK